MTWLLFGTSVGVIVILGLFVLYDIMKIKRNRGRYNWRTALTAYILLIPAIILIIIFVLQPILMGIWFGFTDYYLLRPDEINFIGSENFKALAEQYRSRGDIYHALRNTLQFIVLVLPLQIGVALLLALVLDVKRRGNNFFKVAFFSPVVMSLAVVSILWLQILSPNTTNLGLMNSIFALFGFPPSSFLLDPEVAMYWIVILSAWQGAGFQMLIFLAGLKNIPRDAYEAARIDGADTMEIIRYITLPALKPTFVFVLFTTFIGASKLLIQPMVMIGFKNYSVTLSYLIFREGYQFRFVGYASSIALFVTLFIGLLVVMQRRLLKEAN